MRSLYACWFFGFLLLLRTIGAWAEEGLLVGRVEDRTSGEPLPGAAVLVQRLPMGATADSLGRFAIAGLPVGRYRVEARMVGYRTATAEVEVIASPADGGITEVVLALQRIPLELDEVAVTAVRPGLADMERSPMFLRVIPSETFEGQIVTLPEVLSRSAGVQIKTLGGLGSYSTVSIRGTTAEQVKVYLDGILLNSALGGGVNLGDIPLSNVDRIEVYKGSIPARFGGGGIGGVVNILTKGIVRHYGNYAVSYGTFGTRMAHGLFSRRGDRLGYVLGLDYMKSDNTFPFLDDNGTRYNLDDDVWTERRNNDFTSLTLLTKVELDSPWGLRFTLNDNIYRSDKGIPGIGSFQSQFARLRTTRHLIEAHAVRPRPLWNALRLDLMGFHSTYVSDYRDLKGEVGLGKQDNHNVTTTYGAKIHSTAVVGGSQILSFFVHAQREGFKPSDRLYKTPLLENARTGYGWAVEDEIMLFGDRMTLLPSVQWDRYESRFFGDYTHGHWVETPAKRKHQTLFSRHLGVKLRLRSWWLVKANIGKYHRAPSFYELFGDKGWVIGNTELTPETGLNRDVGLRIEGDLRPGYGGVLELSYYANRLDDMIQFIQYSQKVSKPENIGKAEVKGIELTAGCTLFGHVQFDAEYTYQDARNRTTLYGGIYKDKHLPNKPEHDFSGRMELFDRRHGRVFYEYVEASTNFRDRYNKVRVPRRVIHNVGTMVYVLSEKLQLTVEGKNLTDNQVADLWGYPLPGRSYYVTVRGAF